MTSNAATVDQYLESIPAERKLAMNKLRQTILDSLPEGFQEQITYGMIGYVVPHSTYPNGYHCDPKLPLGFVSIASQKNFIAVYHMGIYASPNLLKWFTDEFLKHSKRKLDMGKSCIRFKKIEEIPYDLIGELMTKMTVQDWISAYEKALNQPRKK
jgi:uncharacterized protein YdhG (YjbR/CyaY superfamily)